MNISLDSKVAIVTGSSSGIGLAVAKSYLQAGIAGLIVVDRHGLAAELESTSGYSINRVAAVQGDVTSEETMIDAVKAATERFGRLDVFVANAGASVVKPLHLHTPEEWDMVMGTNVKSLYWAVRHAVPVMVEQGRGLILVTGSISGSVGIPTQGAYAASKGALHQMTRQLATEYARHGIRVNTIACGTVDTPIVHASAEASGDADAYWRMLREAHPIGRIAQPDEIAAFFTYMASDFAQFFTGATLMMDGGYTAQ